MGIAPSSDTGLVGQRRCGRPPSPALESAHRLARRTGQRTPATRNDPLLQDYLASRKGYHLGVCWGERSIRFSPRSSEQGSHRVPSVVDSQPDCRKARPRRIRPESWNCSISRPRICPHLQGIIFSLRPTWGADSSGQPDHGLPLPGV
jgi:hypothetical protein